MKGRWKTVNGKTHSWNAIEAEQRGELPITRAVEEIYHRLNCKTLKIPRRRVREFLDAHCYAGYHHIAGYNDVRAVDYYRTKLTKEEERLLMGPEIQ